jgi:hypothetical protein
MNQTIITEDDLIFMKKIDDEEAEKQRKKDGADRRWYDGEAERQRLEDLELEELQQSIDQIRNEPRNPKKQTTEWYIEGILKKRQNRVKKLKALHKNTRKMVVHFLII